jgi:hypothetical protein
MASWAQHAVNDAQLSSSEVVSLVEIYFIVPYIAHIYGILRPGPR